MSTIKTSMGDSEQQSYSVDGVQVLVEKAYTFTTQVSEFMLIDKAPPEDASALKYMRMVEDSGVLDFWNHEDEDIYSEADGEPI